MGGRALEEHNQDQSSRPSRMISEEDDDIDLTDFVLQVPRTQFQVF